MNMEELRNIFVLKDDELMQVLSGEEDKGAYSKGDTGTFTSQLLSACESNRQNQYRGKPDDVSKNSPTKIDSEFSSFDYLCRKQNELPKSLQNTPL